MSDSIRELLVALFTEASESMGLMSLQLPWSPTCLLHELPDTRSYRKIPIGCQDRTAVVAQWGQRIVLSYIVGVTQIVERREDSCFISLHSFAVGLRILTAFGTVAVYEYGH
jgi:hypothetical protein